MGLPTATATPSSRRSSASGRSVQAERSSSSAGSPSYLGGRGCTRHVSSRDVANAYPEEAAFEILVVAAAAAAAAVRGRERKR